MKSLLILAMSLVSVNAMALDKNSTWEEILASRKVAVQFPQVSFSAGEVTAFLSVDQLCYTSTLVKTKVPVAIYAHNGRGDASEIVETGKQILATAKNYIQYIPVGEGDRFEAVPATIPTSYNLEVKSGFNGDFDGHTLFTKTFNMPACQ